MGVYLAGNAANQPFNLGSGITVSLSGLSISSNVSGNVVYLVSGHNEVQGTFTAQVSGQPVRVSGQTVIALISGQTVISNANISGQTVGLYDNANGVRAFAPSFDNGNPNDVALNTLANLYGYDGSLDQLARIRVTSSGKGISGIPHKLVVTFSGDSIIGSVSGNMVSVSGQPVRTSGQTNYPVSGQAFMKVFDSFGNTWNNVETASSGAGSIRIGIGGPIPDSIIADVTEANTDAKSTATNLLNVASVLYGYVRSEDEWSRIPVTASGRGVSGAHHRLIVDFSGCPVSISGQTVITSVSGIALDISGNTVYTASGHNQVQMMVYDPSGDTLRQLITTQSGGNTLRVAIGSATTPSLYTNIQDGSVDTVSTGLDGLVSTAFNLGYDEVTNQWKRVRVTASGQGISGIDHKLVVTFSGDPVSISGQPVSISGNVVVASVVTNISGQTVVAEISGQPVSISGQAVRISGSAVTVSGNVVNTSGNSSFEYGTAIRTNTPTVITSLSGGTELSSGVVFSVTIRNASGNAPMWIGGNVGTDVPNSGKGMILFGNESQTYKVDNFNKVKAFARTSGQLLYFTGVDK